MSRRGAGRPYAFDTTVAGKPYRDLIRRRGILAPTNWAVLVCAAQSHINREDSRSKARRFVDRSGHVRELGHDQRLVAHSDIERLRQKKGILMKLLRLSLCATAASFAVSYTH